MFIVLKVPAQACPVVSFVTSFACLGAADAGPMSIVFRNVPGNATKAVRLSPYIPFRFSTSERFVSSK